MVGSQAIAFRFYHAHSRYTVPKHSVHRHGDDGADVFVYRNRDTKYAGRLRCSLVRMHYELVEGELPEDVCRAVSAWVLGGWSMDRPEQMKRPSARRGAAPVVVPREVHRYAMGERGGVGDGE